LLLAVAILKSPGGGFAVEARGAIEGSIVAYWSRLQY
jgi:hypothetical protein